jgi:SAM-dependent methyltransferase
MKKRTWVEKIIYHWQNGGWMGIAAQLHERAPIPLTQKMRWRLGVAYEIEFWRKVFEGRSEYSAGIKERLAITRPLYGEIRKELEKLGRPRVKVLDVGAGPVTCLSTGNLSFHLDITACDALSKHYDALLRRLGIVPAIKTEYCDSEKLVAKYGSNSFDIVYCRNAIDHTYNPALAVEQMLSVSKPSGFVFIEGPPNEAENEQWQGMHQWNLNAADDGDFIIRGRKEIISIRTRLGPTASCDAQVEKNWLKVVIRKRSSIL